jgi:hypothetical protein
MFRRAEGELLKMSTVSIILIVLFFVGVFYYVYSHKDNAALWSDVYAKHIALLVDSAHVGDEVTLDVQRISTIALAHEVPLGDMVMFDNEKQEVCVRLSFGKRSCYGYFAHVDVIHEGSELGVLGNVLHFKIEDKDNA